MNHSLPLLSTDDEIGTLDNSVLTVTPTVVTTDGIGTHPGVLLAIDERDHLLAYDEAVLLAHHLLKAAVDARALADLDGEVPC